MVTPVYSFQIPLVSDSFLFICSSYITSGELPPGTKGAQFIHDPKIARETETKAQVRLKFNDVAGKPATVRFPQHINFS